MNWYLEMLKKYAVFSGRTCRKEYWMFFLFNFTIYVVLLLIQKIELLSRISSVIAFVFTIAMIIPSIAASVRRLHDTDRSGWWFLVTLVPMIGTIILLIFMVPDSVTGQNQYGANPKEGSGNQAKMEKITENRNEDSIEKSILNMFIISLCGIAGNVILLIIVENAAGDEGIVAGIFFMLFSFFVFILTIVLFGMTLISFFLKKIQTKFVVIGMTPIFFVFFMAGYLMWYLK